MKRRASLDELLAAGVVRRASQLPPAEPRRHDADDGAFRVSDWEPWASVAPVLEQFYGVGCVEVTRDGRVLPVPGRPWAFRVLAFLVYGTRAPTWRWSPASDDAIRLLRAYRAYLIFHGEDRGDAGVLSDLRVAVGRIAAREVSDTREIETVVAGFVYVFIDASVRRAGRFTPWKVVWPQFWFGTMPTRMQGAYLRAVGLGRVPSDAALFLDRIASRWGDRRGLAYRPAEEVLQLLGREAPISPSNG